MGDQNTVLDAASVRHLLRRSGFGAPPKDVAKFVGMTRGAAADVLLAYKPKGFRPGGRTHFDIHNSWIKYLLKTKAPLEERLVIFWHDHFATAISKVAPNLMAAQIKTLHAFSKGNFKALVKAIGKNAAMIEYLDTIRNHKDIPNENYARELQELFTLGVYDANGVPNYTQDDIVQIARAFTGWYYESKGWKVAIDPDDHDFAADFPERGPKVIYTTVGGFGPGGRDFTANGEGAPEIDTVVDIIFEHTDSDGKNTVARRMARRLLEYFTHGSPTLADIDAVVANSNFATNAHPNQWSIQALCRAIFTHDAFYETAAPAPFGAGTKKSVRWPIDLVISTMRQLGVKPYSKYLYFIGGHGGVLFDQLRNMGMSLLDPPSVFGWDWETRWISSATLLARYQFVNDIAYTRGGGGTGFHPDRLMDMSLTDAGDIVDAVTDVLCITDQFTTAERDVLINYLTDGSPATPVALDDFNTVNQKLRGLFAIVMQSPQYQQH